MIWMVLWGLGIAASTLVGFLWGSTRVRKRKRRILPARREEATPNELARARQTRQEVSNFLRYDGEDLPA